MDNIYEAFTVWIEDKVRGRRLRWMIGIPSTVGTILTIIGFVFKIQIVAYVSLALLAGWLGICVIVLAIDRRTVRRSLREKDDVLRGYGNSIRAMQEQDQDLFHTLSWDEEVLITNRGDADIIRNYILKVNEKSVPAIWSMSKRNSENYLNSAIRDSVRVSANYMNADGRVGSRIVTTKSWEQEGRLRVYLHFDRPLAPMTEIQIRLHIYWPQFVRDLLDGGTEVVHWTARRPTGGIRSVHTYDKSFTKKEPEITVLEGTPEPTVIRDEQTGSTKVHLNLDSIEVNREYGYRVSLPD